MVKQDLPYILWDLAKIVSGVVRDTLDVGDYRVTIVIERKIDEKMGVVVDSISIDKRMSAFEADIIARRLRSIIEKKQTKRDIDKEMVKTND